jgi:hypothetical protein
VVDHRLEIGDPGLQPEVVDVPVGQPVPAFVVADDGGDLAQVVEEMTPDRTLPVVLQMAEPTGGDDQRRPRAVPGIGDPDAVTGPAEPQFLRRRRPSRDRQNRSSCGGDARRLDNDTSSMLPGADDLWHGYRRPSE